MWGTALKYKFVMKLDHDCLADSNREAGDNRMQEGITVFSIVGVVISGQGSMYSTTIATKHP